MTAEPKPGTLEAAAHRIGHKFTNLAVLEQALTHSSAATPARHHNQRLEFLGDRVLGLVIAEEMTQRHPDESEGALAPRLNELVRKETCAEIAQQIGVGDDLRLGKSEAKTGGRRKTAILGDAMEAVIAAVYLDGGLVAARRVILRHWRDKIDHQGEVAPRDAKTTLQEWAQANGMRPPRYETVDRDGPDHAPLFTVAATLASGETASAKARSKRAAEQEAAGMLVEKLGLTDE